MDWWYQIWVYTHVLNTKWFLWTIVVFILSLNILSPFLLWFVTSSKKADKEGS